MFTNPNYVDGWYITGREAVAVRHRGLWAVEGVEHGFLDGSVHVGRPGDADAPAGLVLVHRIPAPQLATIRKSEWLTVWPGEGEHGPQARSTHTKILGRAKGVLAAQPAAVLFGRGTDGVWAPVAVPASRTS